MDLLKEKRMNKVTHIRLLVLLALVLLFPLITVVALVISRNHTSDFLRESYYALKTMECLFATGKEYSETKDMWAFWPKSQLAFGNRPAYSNSTSFFMQFAGMLNQTFGYSGKWCSEFKANNFSHDKSKWSILLDASNEQPRCVPVLVSQKLNLSSVARFLTSDELAQRQTIEIDRGFVFFRSMEYHLFSGGTNNRANKWSITCEDKAKLPYTATYLTPTGMVTIVFDQERDRNRAKEKK